MEGNHWYASQFLYKISSVVGFGYTEKLANLHTRITRVSRKKLGKFRLVKLCTIFVSKIHGSAIT